MLRNPIHKRLEKLTHWQHMTFMLCLCERMYFNYQAFCTQSQSGNSQLFRQILNLLWDSLLIKDNKVNFDRQLEKLEDIIPDIEQFSLYAKYPALDACIALSETLHAQLSREALGYAITVSEISIRTVSMLEMTQAGRQMDDEELKSLAVIQDELDIQWQIFRLLDDCKEYDMALIKGIRADLQETAVSNIGIKGIKREKM